MEDTMIDFDYCEPPHDEVLMMKIMDGDELQSATSSLTTTEEEDHSDQKNETVTKWTGRYVNQQDGTMFLEDINNSDSNNETFGIHLDGSIQGSNKYDQDRDDDHVLVSTNETYDDESWPVVDSDRHISYAQLFFDPETKSLVTIMEVNLPNRTDLFSSTGDDIVKSPRDGSDPSLGIKSFCGQGHVFSSNFGSVGGSSHTGDINGRSTTTTAGRQVVDETLLTECSSISSATSTASRDDHCDGSRQHDVDIFFYKDKKTSEGANLDGFGYGGGGSVDEPIIFSHNDLNQLWFEENELSMYLLHDDGEPWDAIGLGRRSGCTESLKKLLAASRSCISLRQLGMATASNSSSSNNNKQHPQHLNVASYSALDNE